jgi:hypothetical protein
MLPLMRFGVMGKLGSATDIAVHSDSIAKLEV